jgi:hypothetical protein
MRSTERRRLTCRGDSWPRTRRVRFGSEERSFGGVAESSMRNRESAEGCSEGRLESFGVVRKFSRSAFDSGEEDSLWSSDEGKG